LMTQSMLWNLVADGRPSRVGTKMPNVG
jgi:hypothetical protein